MAYAITWTPLEGEGGIAADGYGTRREAERALAKFLAVHDIPHLRLEDGGCRVRTRDGMPLGTYHVRVVAEAAA